MGLGDLLGDAFDKAKGVVDVGVHAFPNVAVAGFAIDMVTAPWNDDEEYNGFKNTLESRFATRLGDVLEPLDIAGGQSDEAALGWLAPKLERVRSYGVSRPLTTLVNLPKHKFNPVETWNETRSSGDPAQNLYNNLFGTWGRGLEDAGVNASAVLGHAADPGFDINIAAQREEAFDKGLGMVVSGLGDGIIAWNLDPLVLGGRAIGAARSAAVVKPIKPGMTSEALDEMLAPKYATATSAPGKLAERVTHPFDAQRRVTRIFDNLEAMGPTQRADWLARNKTFMPNVGIQHLLTEAKSADEMRMIARAGVDGSEQNMTHLASISLSAYDRMVYLRDVRRPTLQAALDSGRFGNGALSGRSLLGGHGATEQMRRTFEAEIASVNRQLQAADKEWDFARRMESIAGTVREVPRVSLGQKLATTPLYSYDRLGWEGPTWATFQPSKYGPATRVLKSAGTRRPQSVDLNVPGAGTENMKRWMDRVGHGWEKEFVTNLGGRGVPQALKTAHLAEIAAAETRYAAGTGSQMAIIEAMQAAERTGLDHFGRAMAMDDDAVRAVYDEFHARRMTAMGEKGMAGEERFSAVPRPGERGKYLDDVYDHGAGEWIRTPVTTSQFTDTFPLLDVDALTRAMHAHREALKGANGQHLIARLKGAPQAAQYNAVVEEALSKFNRIWKPAQLFRLGWPFRVITDEQFRTIATVGLLTHLPLLVESVRHSARETRLAYRGRDVTTARSRAAAEQGLLERFSDKAADLERSTIVDKIHGIDSQLPGLDARIAAAGAALRAAGKAAEGQRLYVNAPAGAKLKAATPRGQRYEVDQAGRLHGPARSGEATHARLGLDIGDDAVYYTGSRQADPGIAVLEEMLGNRRLGDLYAMTNAELRTVLQREVGPRVSLSRYRTKEDMLSVYGATLARRQGYKAVHHAPGDQATFLALTDDAVRVGDEAAFGRAANELERLRIQRDTLAAQREHLTGRESALPAWTQSMQQEWDDLIAAATRPSDVRRAEGPRAKFSGTRTLAVGGATVAYEDSYAPGAGRVYMDKSSARSTVRSLAGADDRFVNGLRLASGRRTMLTPWAKTGATRDEITAHERSYARSYERATNDQLGKNPLASRLLRGMTDDEAVTWLTRSNVGRAQLRQINPVRASDPRRWVEETRDQIRQYLPTAGLRAAAVEGKATAELLAREVPDVAARPVIHGDSLELTLGGSQIGQLWERAVGAVYDKLGTAPTDILSRHPYFTAIYRGEMERQITEYMTRTTATRPTAAGGEFRAGNVDRISQEQIIAFQNRARQHALRRTRETLYDVANSSNLAHTFRFISPFYAAWQDALTTWGRIWLEDPSRLAHMLQIWQAPSKSHLQTYDDPISGKTYVSLPLPDFVKNKIPVLAGDMPTDYFRSLIFNGDYWMLPGAGAPVTVPLQELTRERPDLYPLLKPLIPYGAGDSMLDDLLPAGWRRAKTSWSKEDDYAWSSAYQRNAMDVYFERRTGKFTGDDDAMYAEAKRRTEDFYRIRTMANFTLPYSPKFNSDYQFYYDQYANLREQYAAFPNGKDPNGKTADEAFLDKYGEDYFIFTSSLTKSNVGGIPATTEGFKASKKYAALIQQNPEYGGLIVGQEAFAGDFNPEVFQYQRSSVVGGGNMNKQRELRSPQDAIRDAEVARGWDRYRRIDTWVDQQLKDRGLRSINAKAAKDIKALKDAAVGKIAKELPHWGEARQTFTRGRAGQFVAFLEDNIDQAPFRDRDYHATLAQYLSARRTMRGMLAQRQSQNLQARENDDLRALWDAVTNKLRQADTSFADLHTRYLSNDDRLDDEGVAA